MRYRVDHWEEAGAFNLSALLGGASANANAALTSATSAANNAASSAQASLSDASDSVSNFYQTAVAKLGGTVTSAEGQALSAMQGWASDAKSAILGNLDADGQQALNIGVQAAQMFANNGVNEQTAIAVMTLAASSVAGPVAGAIVGALGEGLNAAATAIMSVANILGLAAHAAPVDAFCGWLDMTKGQLIPYGPGDAGEGTYGNPGWQSSYTNVERVLGTPACHAGILTGCDPCSCDTTSWGPGGSLLSLPPMAEISEYALATGRLQASDIAGWFKRPAPAAAWPFIAFFLPFLWQNDDLDANCQPVHSLPPQLILAHVATIWNAAHSSSSVVTFQPDSGDGSFAAGMTTAVAGILRGDPSTHTPSMPPLTINTGPSTGAAASSLAAHVAASMKNVSLSQTLANVGASINAVAIAAANQRAAKATTARIQTAKTAAVVGVAGVGALALLQPALFKSLLLKVGLSL
jgi:hypothetical protein